MKKLWISFAVVFCLSFAVLGWIGTRIYQEMPPIPSTVVTTDGTVVLADGDIGRGQNVWQALGGMEVGSIWGHGSYVAPDWTADWLHRETSFVLNDWAVKEFNSPYEELSAENQAKLRGRLEEMYRRNSYDASTNSIVIDPVRARAFEACRTHFSNVFMKGEKAYAIPPGSVDTDKHMRQFAGFIFWTAWAASSNRPHDTITYTHNWPFEPLVGNRPTGESVLWTGVSIIMLLAGICAMVWWYAAEKKEEPAYALPAKDPLGEWHATPSQRATLKYFWVVSALILVQILMGVVTAHYGVEGDGFYGIKLSQILPYSVTRTWHVQLGIFWIATAWLAAGLFIGPLVSKFEPKFQALGVHVLFGALLVVVAGSMAGEWL
ncbi:MAG: cbb3-type cytochrome c oxidase subunit I, partial [Candidatus Acidiferrum sp.]